MYKRLVAPYIQPMAPRPTNLSPEGGFKVAVRCLLCDIYGTLFISGSGDISIALQQKQGYKAVDALLAKYQIDIPPAHLFEAFYNEIRSDHRRSRAKGVDHPEVQIDKIWSRILPINSLEKIRAFAVEFEMLMNPVWPMPGLRELIQMCQKNDIRLGIISNAQFFTPLLFEWFLDTELPSLGFDPHLTFFSYQHGRAKPSVKIFEIAALQLERMGIPAGAVAYVGNDMRNDILPAGKAGFQTVLFAGDARSLRLRQDDPLCSGIAPDVQVAHLKQLASLLAEGFKPQ